MIQAVSDTHAVIWFVWADPRLSIAAKDYMDSILDAGDQIALSSISFVEIIYLAEKRRIDPRTLDRILALLDNQKLFVEFVVDRSIMPSLAAIDRAQVPDMPDRIIAATASHLGVPLISRDGKIRASSVATIW